MSDLGETTQQTLSRILQDAIIKKWDEIKYIIARHRNWEGYNEHIKSIVSYMRREGGYARNYNPNDLWNRVQKECDELIAMKTIARPTEEEITEWFSLPNTFTKQKKSKKTTEEVKEPIKPVSPHTVETDSDKVAGVEYFNIHDGDYGPVHYD
jgi:hypothetical protein